MHIDFGPDVAFGALFPFLEPVADLDNGMWVVASRLPRALAAVAHSAGAEIRTVSPSRPRDQLPRSRISCGLAIAPGTKCDLRLAGMSPAKSARRREGNVHRHNIDVASKYDGESDFATMEVVVQRPAEAKVQATILLPGVLRLRRARPGIDHVASGIYPHLNA
jgi:hypothetical protein